MDREGYRLLVVAGIVFQLKVMAEALKVPETPLPRHKGKRKGLQGPTVTPVEAVPWL